MSDRVKQQKTNDEIVQALFERWGPECKRDWRFIGGNVECPYYTNHYPDDYFEAWSPLTSLDDLAPALLATLREPERMAALFGIFFDLENEQEDCTELGLFALDLIADPETRPLVARAIVAAWEG